MERITFEGNFCDIALCCESPCPYDKACTQRRVWERLKAYEDTGLAPEEIKELIYRFEKCRAIRVALCDPTGKPIAEPGHLRELVQAEKDGRLPKYNIGDTIYDRFGDAWEVNVVELRPINGRIEWIYRCGHAGTDDYCALWETEVLTREEAAALKGGDD